MSADTAPRPVSRLAIRAEGDMVNAYLALPDTMECADLVASMRRSCLEQDEELYSEWLGMLQRFYARTLTAVGVPTSPASLLVRPGPHWERSGGKQ